MILATVFGAIFGGVLTYQLAGVHLGFDDQGRRLQAIVADAMSFRANPSRVAERVRREVDPRAEVGVVPAAAGTGEILISAEAGTFGFDGRWRLRFRTDGSNRVVQAWLVLEYPNSW